MIAALRLVAFLWAVAAFGLFVWIGEFVLALVCAGLAAMIFRGKSW